jgi:hypothetical protein
VGEGVCGMSGGGREGLYGLAGWQGAQQWLHRPDELARGKHGSGGACGTTSPPLPGSRTAMV